MNPFSDEKIIDSWEKNASQWSAAVREGHIESRKLITDKAIVEAVLSYSPESVLDIGCGEGWLIREAARSQKPEKGFRWRLRPPQCGSRSL